MCNNPSDFAAAGVDPGAFRADLPDGLVTSGDLAGMTVAEQATNNTASAGSYPVFVSFACLSIPAPDYSGRNRDFARVISAVASAVVVEPDVLTST